MPDQLPQPRRDSPRVIAADYLTHLPATVVIVAALWTFGSRSDGALGSALTTLSVAYLVLAAVEPVFRQATHSYQLSEEGLRHAMGLIERRRRDFPWASITAVNIDRPWAHRLFGIYRMTLTQAGEEATRVVLRGITRPMVDLVLTRLEAALPPATPEPGVTPAQQRADQVLYAASASELVLMSFVYGQVLVLAAACGATLWDVLDSSGLLLPLGLAAGRFPAWVQVSGAVALVVLIGVLATLIRFFRFTVLVGAQGQLVIRFGLLESQERRIDAAAVEGLVVHRNLLEQLSGRARLALLTTDSATQLRSNLLLPSLPASVVRSLAREYFPELVAAESILERRPRVALTLTALAGLIVLAVSMGIIVDRSTELPLWACLLAALVVFILASTLGKAMSTTFASEAARRLTHVTTRFAFERQTTLRDQSVGRLAAISWLAPGRRHLGVSLGAYTGRSVTFLALFHPREPINGLSRQLLCEPADAERRPQPWEPFQ